MPHQLSELLTTAALAIDLACGRPIGSSLRRCLSTLGDIEGGDRVAVYQAALLSGLGCTATATERAAAGSELTRGRRHAAYDAAEQEAAALLASRVGVDERILEMKVEQAPSEAVEGTGSLGELVEEVLLADPAPDLLLVDERAGLEMLADFADLTSPYLVGHSRRVSSLAAAAGRAAALGETACVDLERAGLVHDLGRVGITSRIWNKAEALAFDEMEQVRLHPRYTEETAEASTMLRGVAELASGHHECLDGSGYHRGVSGEALGRTSRLLAAADDYAALTDPRPHRPSMSHGQAARVLSHFVDGGCLDREAVEAVLSAAEESSTIESEDTELAQLAIHGAAELARARGWSRRAAKRHLAGLHDRLGTTSRSGLALAALQAGILP